MRRFLTGGGVRRCAELVCASRKIRLPPTARDTDHAAAKGTTLIGCLAGPDADDHYTLTNMQHRLGVEVVGGEESEERRGREGEVDGIVGARCLDPKGRRAMRRDVQGDRGERAGREVPGTYGGTPVSKKKAAQQIEARA